jgi:hypothetical protein
VSGLFRTGQKGRVRPALWNPHRRYALSVAGYPASPRVWTTISRPPVPWISCAARMKRAPASPRRRCARRDAERLDCRGVRGRVEPGDTTRPKEYDQAPRPGYVGPNNTARPPRLLPASRRRGELVASGLSETYGLEQTADLQSARRHTETPRRARPGSTAVPARKPDSPGRGT